MTRATIRLYPRGKDASSFAFACEAEYAEQIASLLMLAKADVTAAFVVVNASAVEVFVPRSGETVQAELIDDGPDPRCRCGWSSTIKEYGLRWHAERHKCALAVADLKRFDRGMG